MNKVYFAKKPGGRRYLKISAAVSVLAGLLMIPLLCASPELRAAPASSTPASWQKSVALQSTSSGDFGSAASDAAIDQARQANANFLTLIIPLQQPDVFSTNIYRAGHAPTDGALIHAINKAHSVGMKVSLKLHLDPQDGKWRASINPSDRNTWYQNYSNLLNYYATLGQANKVEQLVVGAELISMATSTSNPDNTQRWRTMIAQVRQRFTGTLTYSANWGGDFFSEEFPHISFWDALDYIGISAYFELSNFVNPSVSQLMDSWNYWTTNKIQPFQSSVGKPVVFTEIGYRSVDGAAMHPWDWSMAGNYNAQEQVNAITALEQFWGKNTWFAGMQYWSWNTNPNCCGVGNTSYEVQNKPGYAALRTAYSTTDTAPSTPTFSLVSTISSPTNGPAGTTFTINASVKASATSSALIDMEIYDKAGTRVYQQYMANQSFTAGATRTFAFTWASPANQAPGEFTVSLGVFTNDWATAYLWSGNAATITINPASVTPAPAPTSTPVPAPPTPTKAPVPGNPPPTNTPVPAPPTATPVAGQYTISIWWPTNGATLSGIQPFKAVVNNLNLSQYNLYWQVDGGNLVLMPDNHTDAPHKEASVAVNGWTWRGRGPYTVNFVAKDLSGSTLVQQSIQIFVQN